MKFEMKAKVIDPQAWKWRFAFLPTRFCRSNWDTVWIWLEWYEIRGGNFDVYNYYRISTGEEFKYQTPSTL